MSSLEQSILDAANRLADNLAFVVNHVTLPDQWYEKLVRELEEDRAKIASFPIPLTHGERE